MVISWLGTLAVLLNRFWRALFRVECIEESYGLSFTTVLLQMTPDMIDRGPGEYSGIVYIFLDFLDC